ncbi:GGDEF domain-containing protein [Deinococcus aquatilis]|jgi:diguanylate cyclase (GGDEF)-like protein|uniref:GGDEF domain-containing protein n=1 Tax=Deinococcus aquatilis TaxID=519440 RepID=UPI00146E96CE|nr:GGDEF domain-containing protein [Deinococcus aquatilis]
MVFQSLPVRLRAWSSLQRQWKDPPKIHSAKRRIYAICLIMASMALVVTTFLSQTDVRIFQLNLIVNSFGVILSLIALLLLWRWHLWMRIIEVLIVTGIFSYTILWDAMYLRFNLLPNREFVITYQPVFLLGAVILSLMVPQRALLPLLSVPFFTHVVLSRLLLSHFIWGEVHSARLITELSTLITLIPLTLIGEYQRAVILAEQAAQSIHKLAETDSLTGILNRRGLMSQFGQEFAVVALLDIDHFKSINDTYGHEQGDAVLQGVGEYLHGWASADLSSHQSVQVGRWGGEEFLVLLRQCPAEGIAVWAERLRAGLERLCPSGLAITVSIGVAVKLSEESVTQTLRRVDKLMYQAKFGGRNRVAVAGGVSQQSALEVTQ